MECILENIGRWLVFDCKAQLSRRMRQFERRKAVETGVCRVFCSTSARHVNVASAPSIIRLLQRSFGPKRSFSTLSTTSDCKRALAIKQRNLNSESLNGVCSFSSGQYLNQLVCGV